MELKTGLFHISIIQTFVINLILQKLETEKMKSDANFFVINMTELETYMVYLSVLKILLLP